VIALSDNLLSETRHNGFTVRTFLEPVTDDERSARDQTALRKLKQLLAVKQATEESSSPGI
jgi:hypothetical protein